MATTTPRQSLPVPTTDDDPHIVEDLTNLAIAIEKRLFGVYADSSDRDARNTAPEEGQVAYLRGTNTIDVYDGSTWLQVYPPDLPSFTSGTTAPSNDDGDDGDVYFQV